MKKAILILAGPYTACIATQKVWQHECTKNNIKLKIYTPDDGSGKNYVEQYNLKSFPALIISNKVVAVGHPDNRVAAELLEKLTI